MNIFELDDPQKQYCWVISYVDDMPEIIIGVREAGKSFQDTIFLRFVGVEYFEGQMKWVGANFQIGSIQERNDLMHSYASWPNDVEIPEDRLISVRDEETLLSHFENHSLYKVKSLQGFEIKIVANQAFKTTNLPE